jgi:hypothetical protein
MSDIFRQASSALAGVGASGSALSREDPPQAVMMSARASALPARFTRGSIRPQLLPLLQAQLQGRLPRRRRRPRASA